MKSQHCHRIMDKLGSEVEQHSVVLEQMLCSKHTKRGSIDFLNGGVAQTICSAKETVEASCEVNQGARQIPACLPHKQSMSLHNITFSVLPLLLHLFLDQNAS